MIIKRISGQRLVPVQGSDEVKAEVAARHSEQLSKLNDELQSERAKDPRELELTEDDPNADS